ncbi:hypothetical protein [Microbulbifer yueqingensis]|uniref:Uncharacterized protein n=1 Tax=Microbulbifer yueqingensis TaxID=658219 RepID=A0A1G8ZN42_9GAMM|nr:hypothetical protein [Microbulbifer yueqingensis]SDK16542.1 hypothetical protein SAMN05216212_1689 [Microbulbifer yueqingensis]
MRITLVKKVLADGSPCAKCHDVEQKLLEKDQMRFIDEVLVADERDPGSAGFQLASKHAVSRAPFFVVENAGGRGDVEVFTVYFKFAKEVLQPLENAAAAS